MPSYSASQHDPKYLHLWLYCITWWIYWQVFSQPEQGWPMLSERHTALIRARRRVTQRLILIQAVCINGTIVMICGLRVPINKVQNCILLSYRMVDLLFAKTIIWMKSRLEIFLDSCKQSTVRLLEEKCNMLEFYVLVRDVHPCWVDSILCMTAFHFCFLLYFRRKVDNTRLKFKPAFLHVEIIPFFHGMFYIIQANQKPDKMRNFNLYWQYLMLFI